ncbi:MAG: hypothetical protein AAFX01_04380 [Cyanobacteria bacterium J06638_28]
MPPSNRSRTIHVELEIEANLERSLAGLEYWYQLGLLAPESLKVDLQAQSESSQPQTIAVTTNVLPTQLLTVLKTCQRSGLLSQGTVHLQLALDSQHARLLEGLDRWLQLQLLPESTAIRLCQEHLTCDVPLAPTAAPSAQPRANVPQQTAVSLTPAITEDFIAQDFAATEALTPTAPREPNFWVKAWRSLMAELSVIWLLVLGVILVLLSSGVLVANQWQRFPAAGQYSILWIYTLAFGASALWCGRRDRLQLTAKALRLVTLLLIPLNFIAMDAFSLWQSVLGLGVSATAAVSLGALMVHFSRQQTQQTETASPPFWPQLLLLSLVHWGWGLALGPVVALYVGVIGSAVIFLRSQRHVVTTLDEPALDEAETPQKAHQWGGSLQASVLLYGLGVLWLRAIAGYQIPWSQVGLALGIGGFLVAWTTFAPQAFALSSSPEANPQPTQSDTLTQLNLSLWEVLGGGLMGLGWSLSVMTAPWQSLGVSFLAIAVFGRRLLSTWSRFDLTGLFLMGLQSVWLIWTMVPEAGQSYAQTVGERLVGSQGQPWAGLSLVLFPYLLGVVGTSDWLARYRQRDLARFSGHLALGLGIVLVGLGTLNPTLRVLSLGGATSLLAGVTQRRWRQFVEHRLSWAIAPEPMQKLGTLTHVTALLTLAALGARLLPNLGVLGWSVFGLGVMAGEWLFSLGATVDIDLPDTDQGLLRLLRGSAWSLCLIAGGLTYSGLFLAQRLVPISLSGFTPTWGLLGIAVPGLLTAMAALVRSRRELAVHLSLGALCLLPGLTWGSSMPRLLSLGIATGLMVLNTHYQRTRLVALVTVGFGLTLTAASLDYTVGVTAETTPIWLLAGAIAPLLLWLAYHQLNRRESSLVTQLAQAADLWAFPLIWMTLLGGIYWAFFESFSGSDRFPLEIVAALLLMGATTYRSRIAPYYMGLHFHSVAVICLSQFITIWQMPWQFLGLTTGMGLLFLQSRWTRQLSIAALTIGLALIAETLLIRQNFSLRPLWGIPVLASTVACLWGIRYGLAQFASRLAPVSVSPSPPVANLESVPAAATALTLESPKSSGQSTVVSPEIWLQRVISTAPATASWTELLNLYAKACDGWAIGLVGLTLMLTFQGTATDQLLAPTPETFARVVAVTSGLLGVMVATAYRSWQLPGRAGYAWVSTAVMALSLAALAEVPAARLMILGTATAIMAIHSRYWVSRQAAAVTLGLGLSTVAIGLWDGYRIAPIRMVTHWILVIALCAAMLWIGRQGWRRPPTRLLVVYRKAADHWAWSLGLIGLVCLTGHAFFTVTDRQVAPLAVVLAAAFIVGALLIRYWQRPCNWGIYAIGWGLELFVIEGWSRLSQSLVALAIANILLGIAVQLLGDWLHRRRMSPAMLSSWHILPLFYGGLGAALRTGFFNSWTGLCTLGLVIIAMGLGRRQASFKPLIYVAIAGISVTAFELLLYPVQAFARGDQLIALAALAATLVYAYRLLTPWLAPYLRLPSHELVWVAHTHWAMGSGLLLGALVYPLEHSALLGLGTGFFLTRYALKQGQTSSPSSLAEAWVYLGGLEALGILVQGSTLLLPATVLQSLLPWVAAIASALAVMLYAIPWQRWGWSVRPWHVLLGALPLVAVALTYSSIALMSLLIAAAFYGFIAWRHQQWRWSYVSLGLANWAAYKGLSAFNEVTLFTLACLVGLSLLYIAWVDPYWHVPTSRRDRHYLRLAATGLICGVPLFTHNAVGLLPGVVSLIALSLGLVLRIRAFLYVGTAVFLANAVYQLLVLSFVYPLLKWIIGLIAGLGFIVTAANFENRRAQVSTLINSWNRALQVWE